MTLLRLRNFLPILALFGLVPPAAARDDSLNPVPTGAAVLNYADLVDLAESAQLVIRARILTLIPLEPARMPAIRPGWWRFYVEARTEALIAGQTPLGEALTYLVDLPLDHKGKPPRLKKSSVVVFARPVRGSPGALQLVAPDAQVPWDPLLDSRLSAILGKLLASDVPPRITGVREAIHVSGDLAGEGETQLFLVSANGDPAAITITRRPGAPPRWSLSFDELVASNRPPPERDSLAWYRLACFLPSTLPPSATNMGTNEDRLAAAQDYAWVWRQLGPCPRSRG